MEPQFRSLFVHDSSALAIMQLESGHEHSLELGHDDGSIDGSKCLMDEVLVFLLCDGQFWGTEKQSFKPIISRKIGVGMK